MPFRDDIKSIGVSASGNLTAIRSEEATKNALILPFIQALGYNPFDIKEVVPEYTCDIGTRQRERIDYAIQFNGSPTILIECKYWNEKLDAHNNQLVRYFNVSRAKFAVMTNGINYQFFTDLDAPNRMDAQPFLEFDIRNISDTHIEELEKFHKSQYNLENILATATDLKYTNALRTIILQELQNPTPALVEFLTRQVYGGRIVPRISEQFTGLVKRSMREAVTEILTNRFAQALRQNEPEENLEQEQQEEELTRDDRIETTEEELECYYTIRAILQPFVTPTRVFYRDAINYFSVLLDDNNRRPICRIRLGGRCPTIALFDENRQEVRFPLNSIDDLFPLADKMGATVQRYEQGGQSITAAPDDAEPADPAPADE